MPRDDPFKDLLLRIDSLDETLRVARDLCAGIGGFFVTTSGQVRTTDMSEIAVDDVLRRAQALARSCLVHPAVRERALFSNAEMTSEVDAADGALACVALPVWSNRTSFGVLGVIDTWLPELDDEQRAGLVSLGEALSRELLDAGNVEPPEPRSLALPEVVSWTQRSGADDVQAEQADEQPVPVEHPTYTPATEPVAATPAVPDRYTAEPEPVVEVAGGERLESFLGEVLDHLPQGLLVTRSDGAVVLVNQTFSNMTGLPIDALLGEDASEIITAPDLQAGHPSTAEWVTEVLGKPQPERSLLVNKGSGDQLVAQAFGRPLASRYAGDCLVTLIREVPASGVGQQVRSAPLDELIDSLDDGIICLDSDGVVLMANAAARTLHGFEPDRSMVGLPFTGATSLRATGGEPLASADHPLLEALRDGATRTAHLILPARGDAAAVHISISAKAVQVAHGRGAIAVLRDVTAEWIEQEQLAHYALHDPLTGLANRYLLLEELQRMLRGLSRRGGSVSLVFLDLDDFKPINDQHGHAIGDEILKAVGRRLQGAVRGDDVVARLGGDEFIVAHVSKTQLADGDRIVARIRKVLSAPYLVGSGVLDVRVSLGWVSTGSNDVTPQDLLDKADKVMYAEKRHRARGSLEQ